MALFSLALSAAGSAPTGGLVVDRHSVTVASLISLAVYLVPSVALLMSFDAVAGELERGTLSLLRTYLFTLLEILQGKLLAHLGVLLLAVIVGYALAAASFWVDPNALDGQLGLLSRTWTSLPLGAAFLGAGYALSSLARRPTGAAGLAMGLELLAVVYYGLGLLAAVVADNGGWFTTTAFLSALLANPARCVPPLQPRGFRGDSGRSQGGGRGQFHPALAIRRLGPDLAAAGVGPCQRGVPKSHPMKRALILALLLAACMEEAQDLSPDALAAEAVGHYCQMDFIEHPGPKA